MTQVLPKWTVTVNFNDGSHIKFAIHDHFLNNVLRRAADIMFDKPIVNFTITPAEPLTNNAKGQENAAH